MIGGVATAKKKIHPSGVIARMMIKCKIQPVVDLTCPPIDTIYDLISDVLLATILIYVWSFIDQSIIM